MRKYTATEKDKDIADGDDRECESGPHCIEVRGKSDRVGKSERVSQDEEMRLTRGRRE